MAAEHGPSSGKTAYLAVKPRSTLWFGPLIMLGVFLLVFGLILWFTEENNRKAKQADLSARARTFSGTVQLTLQGNAGYLAMLALERSAGQLSPALFQQRAGQYVQAHPELINITWVDRNFAIRDVAPLAPNRQIVGLQLNLPEPKRASRLAMERREPVYTRPFQAIQGAPSFEVWVPVYRDSTFLGLFGGVYSCDKLLEQLVLQTRPRLYHLSLVDSSGGVLANSPLLDQPDKNLFTETPLTAGGSDVLLRVNRYESGRDWRLILLKFLSFVLVLAMSYALWKLKREMDVRRRAEEEIIQQASQLELEVAERQSAQEHLQEQAVVLEEEIAERQQAEDALRASEEKHLLLLDSTGEGIYGIDLDGRCTFCNKACVRMLGYQHPDQLLGTNMHEVIHHSHADGSLLPRESCTAHRTLREGKGTHVVNGVFWRADQSSIPVEYWSYPQIKEGKVVGAVVAFINISERKLLEEQVRQSQKMESVGRLAGGVAHDFNNMLSVILGAAELSRHKIEEGEPVGQYLDVIVDAARRSSEITRQLLAFSRKEVVSPRPADLNQLIEESRRILTRLISEDIQLSFHPGDQLWIVMIDPSQLDQILLNLAVNARDAMPRGGSLAIETANLHISGDYAQLHPEARPGDYVRLTVSDTGTGMDKGTQEHIFEPFFTTKPMGKGTGLGLATVYGIVSQNGGFINVYSEPGQGAVFRIYLPRLAQKAVPDEVSLPPAPGCSETVLLVEDEEMLLWVATRLLEEMGYLVIQAPTPGRAIAICREQGKKIDLILTDVVMPEMNGREMIGRIKEIRPELKVLFMSGYTSDNAVQRGIVDEGMQYLQKPLEMHKLNEKIRQVLAEK